VRWVEVAAIRPHRCAVIPFISGHDELGYIDTGSEMDGFDNHVYVSVKAVKEMARLIGLPSRAEYHEAATELAAVQAELEKITTERDDLEARFEAIDILASRGFVERKKTGRPKKEVAA
jgi:hypothetical protein